MFLAGRGGGGGVREVQLVRLLLHQRPRLRDRPPLQPRKSPGDFKLFIVSTLLEKPSKSDLYIIFWVFKDENYVCLTQFLPNQNFFSFRLNNQISHLNYEFLNEENTGMFN